MALDTGRRTQMLKGLLDLCVLAVLNDGPHYGYGLVGALHDRGFELVAEGSVYPLLARMEKAGLVTSFKAPSPEGPRRKYYELSDQGATALAEGIGDWQIVARQVNQLFSAADTTVTSTPRTEQPCPT